MRRYLEVNSLTRAQIARLVLAFLMATGGFAVVMVFFGMIEQISLMTTVLGVLGAAMVLAGGPIVFVARQSADAVYGTMVVGLGIVAGVLVGNLIAPPVLSFLF